MNQFFHCYFSPKLYIYLYIYVCVCVCNVNGRLGVDVHIAKRLTTLQEESEPFSLHNKKNSGKWLIAWKTKAKQINYIRSQKILTKKNLKKKRKEIQKKQMKSKYCLLKSFAYHQLESLANLSTHTSLFFLIDILFRLGLHL